MKISVLSENTSISPDLGSEHGLSLFIETDSHNIIFDTGASDLFLNNAVKMSIDVSTADLIVISHGHHDHGGGLPDLLRINKTADIYASPFVFNDFRAINDKGEANYIGLDRELSAESRIIKTTEHHIIDDALTLFSNVKGSFPRPSGNKTLFRRTDASNINDDFIHEQNLIIREGDKYVLIAGCAHCGIVNIAEHCHAILGVYPNYVLGGFHLFNPTTGDYESTEAINTIAQALLKTGSMFYTGHCTGLSAYDKLRSAMGDKIDALSTGKTINI